MQHQQQQRLLRAAAQVAARLAPPLGAAAESPWASGCCLQRRAAASAAGQAERGREGQRWGRVESSSCSLPQFKIAGHQSFGSQAAAAAEQAQVVAVVGSRATRGESSSSGGSMEEATGSSSEVILRKRAGFAAVATLNRPKALNALDTHAVTELKSLYDEWDKDPSVAVIILKGKGRAFCAGGDIRMMYNMGSTSGQLAACMDFFRKEYELNFRLSSLSTPHVALLDGVVMGGGNGVAMHGPFRVVTESTLFAMPETAIGLHPDVGASYFLPRLPGFLGEYLGLTGTRLSAAAMLHCGLATHFVPQQRLSLLEARLGRLQLADREAVDAAIREHAEMVMPAGREERRRNELIDKCFQFETMEEIVAALESGAASGEDKEWHETTLSKLRQMSPLSLKITLRSIREGRQQNLFSCLKKEFRLSCHAVNGTSSSDFYEGVRAMIMDKDNKPKWNPSTLEEVTDDMVAAHFSSVKAFGEAELDLPLVRRTSSKL